MDNRGKLPAYELPADAYELPADAPDLLHPEAAVNGRLALRATNVTSLTESQMMDASMSI